jgi:proline iminopeptidase
MLINIPARGPIPATQIYAEHLTKPSKHKRDTMIMLPGGPGGNHSVYDAIRDKLLEHVDLILIDPRGCGLSEPSELKFCSMEVCADDIQAIKQHFDLNDFILFGGSYGSILALNYATTYQDLKKLILLAGATSFRFMGKAKANLQRLGNSEQIKMGKKLFDGQFKTQEELKEYYSIMMPLYIKKPAQNTVPAAIKKPIPYNVELFSFGFRDFLRNFDFEKDLSKINSPTLIMFGKDDWINDPSEGEIMARSIANSKLAIFDDCGHFIWQDQPELFYKALDSFLRD